MPVGLTEISLVSWQAILGMGCLFVVLGAVFTLVHKRERNRYYNGILLKKDVKEAITHEPERPWLSAWQIGARICFVVGGGLVIAGAVLWLLEFPG